MLNSVCRRLYSAFELVRFRDDRNPRGSALAIVALLTYAPLWTDGNAALAQSASDGSASSTPGIGQSAPSEILVKFNDDVSEAEIGEINRAHGAIILEHIKEIGVYRLQIPPDQNIQEEIRLYDEDPRTEYAEPNYVGSGGAFTPNDTFFGDQWHLNNVGQAGGTHDADIDAVEGWQITRGSSSVVVAILDSGIDADHPEFQGRLLPGYDFVEGDADPDADHPHGKWVASILAANADNNFGGAGVDHRAKILPVKVLNAQNSGTTTNLVRGLMFAADEGADVINMSLVNYPLTTTLQNALQYARDAGAILIACAGNGGIGDADNSAPGRSSLTISVGATDNNDTRASSSGTGAALDVVAPGVTLITTGLDPEVDESNWFTGCSAATPVVSGIATLLLSLDRSLSHEDVRRILIASAEDQVGPAAQDKPGRDNFYGFGRVNLRDALLEVGKPVAEIIVAVDIRPERCPNQITVVQGRRRNTVQAAILGSAALDVSEVDLASVRLARVAPLDSRVTGTIKEVAKPFVPFVGKEDARDCTSERFDRFKDMLLEFDAAAIVAGLGPVSDGDVLTVPLAGALRDGTAIRGEDVAIITIVQRRR